jgi:hypothetical protein
MVDTRLLVAAMAAQCRDVVHDALEDETDLPKELHPKHLLWMCDQITEHSQEWTAAKLHRWLGFIQCGLLAHRMLSLEQVKRMFDDVQKSHGFSSEDHDLVDHLDPSSAFHLETGGQG